MTPDRPRTDLDEFQRFLSAEPVAPPKGLTDTVYSQVRHDLNPTFWRVFLKLLGIHAVLGFLTLLFCPQFGISPFSGMGLYGIFMRWGEKACMFGCGAVFLGGSLLVASILLRPEEVRAIRNARILQVAFLSLLSIGFFICAGAPIVFGLTSLWVLGSFLGGVGSLEAGWALRKHLLMKRA